MARVITQVPYNEYLTEGKRRASLLLGFLVAIFVVIGLFYFGILTADWLFESNISLIILIVIFLGITSLVTYTIQKILKIQK